MSTSVFFNNFTNSPEQLLIEDLVLESIKIYGHNLYYCPRTLVAKDDIYGEDTISEYNSAYEIDMYIRSYDSYEGDGNFLSKFGLEIRDQVTFVVSLRNFDNEIGNIAMIDRPQEGDLIYLPMADRLMVVKYVDKTAASFYQMGAIQMHHLVCEMFEYSSERLNTGIDAIDSIETNFSLDASGYSLLTQDMFIITDQNGYQIVQSGYNFEVQARDPYEDNTEFQLEGESILDWSQIDPFSESKV
jgi:hypothetical protein